MGLYKITDSHLKALNRLKFSLPVTHVYNPLIYARKAYDVYLEKYGKNPKEILLVGMNPGPWGMAQTGVPFGEIHAVRNWMGIETPIGRPKKIHPKRPVYGFHCKRSEVSGKRLWGWVEKTFHTPEAFFSRFFVANYCPLMFFETDGKNRTPNYIRISERKPLLSVCDRALLKTALHLKPRYVLGIGEFAAGRAHTTLSGLDISVGRITHPSPANPKANKGWESLIMTELAQLGIKI